MQHLSINSYLQNGKYKIERVLGQGGFGITYLAYQPLLDRKVCIKEFFYKDYCERNEATSHVTLGTQSAQEMVHRFMNKFIKEAQTISQQKHPNIIDIYDIFTENNTAYYVMEYIEGESLSDMVKRNGALSEDAAGNYIRQVANALSYIHAKSINHLDIKPANIMVRKSDSTAVLIDFGLSKQYDSTGGQTSSTPVGISEGYAPLEQYQAGGVSTFTPQTDIYSLGATLFYLVTGTVPPSASEVLNNGLPALPSHISASTKTAIIQAMQFRKNDRPQSVKAFLNLLDGNSNATIASQNTNRPKAYKTVFVDDEATKVVGMSDLDRQQEENKRKREAERKAAEEKARKEVEEKAAKEKREREEAERKRREREAEEERIREMKQAANRKIWMGVIVAIVLLFGFILLQNGTGTNPNSNVDIVAEDSAVECVTEVEEVAGPVMANSAIDVSASKTIKLDGYIDGKYGVVMNIEIKHDGTVSGSYYYKKKGNSSRLSLSGKYEKEGGMRIQEFNSEGIQSGLFEGNFNGSTYTGYFTSYRGDTMPFSIYVQK
ncbi:MAG: serine/threonine protein kinase [Bacteroidaceae bacterium]|nr:serine/threonine protein kinase [Bacteroidaceae bacterium]